MKGGCAPKAPRYLHPGSLGRTLVEATARALLGLDCQGLAETSRTAWLGQSSTMDAWRSGRAASTALPADRAGEIDPDRVAEWVVGQYGAGQFAGVVLGSAHGSAAHLAVALGMAWLPTGFEVDLTWPDGGLDKLDDAIEQGRRVAEVLQERPDVALRQVHDPVRFGELAGRLTTHHLSWLQLPSAYRRFIEEQTPAGSPVVLLGDVRRWPVLSDAADWSFQLGSPMSGLNPGSYLGALSMRSSEVSMSAAYRFASRASGHPFAEHGVDGRFEHQVADWAAGRGRPVLGVKYNRPEDLSAAVADAIRLWLRAAGKTGDRLVVEGGRLLDPYHVLRSGLVPYWCESSTRPGVDAAALWLAGSEPFTSIDALPEPPGMDAPGIATIQQ